MVVNDYNPSTWKAETGRLKFEDNLDYTVSTKLAKAI
jgi:hypothetical protein